MDYRTIGTGKLEVSSICLGTMTFGQQNTEEEGHAQLDLAVDRGVNFFDTAEMYPVPPRAETVHRTESIVGTWLKKRDRSKVIVATKVTGPNRNMSWIRGGPLAFDRKNIREAIEGSLRRLQTDYVDLYQLHWPDRNVPMFGTYRFDPAAEHPTVSILEQLEALSELIQEGKVREIGLSNETPWGVMEFLRHSREKGLPRIVSTQNAYNLINRSFETGLAEISYRERVGLLAYSPLAFGLLSGKYLDDPKAKGRLTDFAGFAQRYQKPAVPMALEKYREVAHRHGMSLATMALSFVYGQSFVASTIIGATGMEQLTENLDALNRPLDRGILEEIEKVHLVHMNPAP